VFSDATREEEAHEEYNRRCCLFVVEISALLVFYSSFFPSAAALFSVGFLSIAKGVFPLAIERELGQSDKSKK